MCIEPFPGPIKSLYETITFLYLWDLICLCFFFPPQPSQLDITPIAQFIGNSYLELSSQKIEKLIANDKKQTNT